MKVYTVYACTDGKDVWLVIERLPAMREKHVNEISRTKLIRQDTLVTIIVTDTRLAVKDVIAITNKCFDNQSTWETVDLSKPKPEPVNPPVRSGRYGR